MSTKYLFRVSLAIIVVSVLGLAVFYLMRSSLPPAVDWNWPEEVNGRKLDVPAQKQLVMEYRKHANGTARFLAGAKASERLDRITVSNDPNKLEFEERYDTRSFFESARWHATTVIVLFYILLACGFMGLLRLRAKHWVLASNTILVLALLGGGALLFFTGASSLAALMVPLMLFGFFGQLVGANLLPGADHPMIVAAEAELRALSPSGRAAHIAKRFIGGILLVAIGGGLTALSIAILPQGAVVATGAIAGGLFMMTTPLIASIRLRARPR
jgi:hypothetical protein